MYTIIMLFCILWCLYFLLAARTIRLVPLFEELKVSEPEKLPKLSIVIAACNEADTVGLALPTLLNQDYPDLEIVAVNDRSTDTTGEILDELARTDSRLKVIHIDKLPERWLGKVHALHQGADQAQGEWLLFTDADIHLAPGTLRKAVAHAITEQCDHLTLFPKSSSGSFILSIVMAAFRIMFLQRTRVTRVHDPESDAAIGVGAFNLVHKCMLDRTPGFEWLRLEVGDDVGLGYMIKQHGGKSCFAFGREHVQLQWYHSVRQMFSGMEKNMFAVAAHYSLFKVLVSTVLLWLLISAPFVAITQVSTPWIFVSGLVGVTVFVLSILYITRRLKTPVLSSLLAPVGMLLISIMLINSAYHCKRRGGINWRGTFYSLEELRSGARLRI